MFHRSQTQHPTYRAFREAPELAAKLELPGPLKRSGVVLLCESSMLLGYASWSLLLQSFSSASRTAGTVEPTQRRKDSRRNTQPSTRPTAHGPRPTVHGCPWFIIHGMDKVSHLPSSPLPPPIDLSRPPSAVEWMNRGPLSPLSPQLAGFSGTRDRAVPVWACFAILMPASNHRSPVHRRPAPCVRPMGKHWLLVRLMTSSRTAGAAQRAAAKLCKVAIAECHQPPNARHHGHINKTEHQHAGLPHQSMRPRTQKRTRTQSTKRRPHPSPERGPSSQVPNWISTPPCLARRQESDCSQAACMPNIPT